MQPIRLRILGEWWDSHVYAGSLFLMRDDGSAVLIQWPRLIDHLIQKYRLDRLGAELAFVDARYLYGEQWSRLVRDSEIADIIQRKFDRLATQDLEVDANDLDAGRRVELGPIAPELLADVEIYRNVVLFGNEEGLWAQRRTLLAQDESSVRIWDCPVFRVRAHRGVIALAAGGDGLFQMPASSHPRAVADADPLVWGDFFSCGWVATNIYASSYQNAGTLAVFTQRREPNERIVRRRFEGTIPDEAVFGSRELMAETAARASSSDLDVDAQAEPITTEKGEDATVRFEHAIEPQEARRQHAGLSWGAEDLICRTAQRGIQISRYVGRRRKLEDRFSPALIRELPAPGKVIAGDVAPFGVVVESDDDLFVLADEGLWNVGYEPARWRSFGRATNYPNHLHVVGEGFVDVFSFLTRSLYDANGRTRLMGRVRRA